MQSFCLSRRPLARHGQLHQTILACTHLASTIPMSPSPARREQSSSRWTEKVDAAEPDARLATGSSRVDSQGRPVCVCSILHKDAGGLACGLLGHRQAGRTDGRMFASAELGWAIGEEIPRSARPPRRTLRWTRTRTCRKSAEQQPLWSVDRAREGRVLTFHLSAHASRQSVAAKVRYYLAIVSSTSIRS